MIFAELPSAEYLHACLLFEEATGKLYWKHRPVEHFSSQQYQRRWNTRYAGTEAFVTVNASGHKTSAIDKRLYLAHRVIWKLVTGQEPIALIDHVDRNPANNKFENIREASASENQINRACEKVRGVQQVKSGKWLSSIRKNRVCYRLGLFASYEDAVQARRKKETALYGAFAP